MRRKDSAIQQQVANLQMKIVQEDRAVESRTTDLLTDWEKTKPVTVCVCMVLGLGTFLWEQEQVTVVHPRARWDQIAPESCRVSAAHPSSAVSHSGQPPQPLTLLTLWVSEPLKR